MEAVCSDEGLAFEMSATHQTPQAEKEKLEIRLKSVYRKSNYVRINEINRHPINVK